jgi:tetratricopeptide (TPR) repeat protein
MAGKNKKPNKNPTKPAIITEEKEVSPLPPSPTPLPSYDTTKNIVLNPVQSFSLGTNNPRGDSTILQNNLLNTIKNKNVCLNMIVKNESRVILRLLESVVNYIDCYCICDTGSTDNTVEIIQQFFSSREHLIPGKIIHEPFRDFGYNRTFALKACEQIDVKYILLLDADMIFKVDPSITKTGFQNLLQADAYYIFQGSDTFFYKNVRIVKNKLGMVYWGVTHEYVKTPEGTKYEQMDKDQIFINDIGDGGCKSDKFVRDVQLLKKGLEDEPNNDRYTFYLANSYRDAGQYDNAIECYKKRIEIGGWFDEVWHSYYSIGKCYKNKGDMANAVYWWLEAYNFFPKRIENLYEIIHHYRCHGKNNLAYGIFIMADHERKNNKTTDYLFLQKDVYDYKLDYELSIIGYYCNYQNYCLQKTSLKVLNYPFVEESISRNVLSNYKFYCSSLTKNWPNSLLNQNKEVLESIGDTILELVDGSPDFVSSTPSMCLNKEGNLVVNVRYVDYTINKDGGYENKGTISTKNVVALIDISNPHHWVLKNEFIIKYNKELDNLYVGLEDVRLFTKKEDEQIYFNANRGLSYHNIKIEHGMIDMEKGDTLSGLISMENQREVEKNWVLFEDSDNKTKIIYNWSPLVIGDIDYGKLPITRLQPMKFIKTHEIKNPYFFKHLRGSSNGVKIGNEIWFICHTVSYEDRRYYYHVFVVLDSTTYEVIKFTRYFSFEKEKVEYSLGFVYMEKTNQILIGYSLMDKETKYWIGDKSLIDTMMITEASLVTNTDIQIIQ